MIRSYKEEQELKEKILELRKKNYPYDKIAMELGTNESRVKLIIGLLVEEGKLDSLATNLYKKETEEKLKQILSMAKAKRNVSEISSSLGISVDRTYLYLDRLVEEGRLSIAEVYQCADEEIEKRVIELRKAGLGQREIMKEMKITKQDTLRRILDKLFSEGKIDSYKKVDKTKKEYQKENTKQTVDDIIKATNDKLNSYFESKEDIKNKGNLYKKLITFSGICIGIILI